MPNRSYHFPPSSDPVELYDATPNQPYFVVGEVQAHADEFSSKDDLMQELKRQAGKIGADAIINIEYSQRRYELFAKGIAIKWKEKQDEFEFLE